MRKAGIGILMTGMAVCLCFGKINVSAALLRTPEAEKAAYQRHLVRGGNWNSSDDKKYTQDEYEFAVSLKFDGYESMKVGDYNKKVLDWEDETAFHKTEGILEKVYWGLRDDDPEYEFFMTTLSNTWEECSELHYNACHKEKPNYSGEASVETFGDIYGDKVVLTGAYAEFSFDYDMDSLEDMTVAQRDQALEGVQTQMQEFLDQFDQSELRDEQKMEEVLKEKLIQILETDPDKVSADTDPYLYYYWQPNWNELEDDGISENSSDDTSNETVSKEELKEQYDVVLNALHFSDYESMPVSEFNREVNSVLNGEKMTEEFLKAYEAVLWASEYERTGKEEDFLNNIIQTSIKEYSARAKEVYSGKTVDPEHSDYFQIEHKEDVFGDEVATGISYAYYTFTYRILDADELTVSEREQFLDSVKAGVVDILEKSENPGKFSADQLKSAIESAGASASTDKIQFTGYKIEDFDSEEMD